MLGQLSVKQLAIGRLLGLRLDDGSRMTRECHVRFWERLRGQFPRPTHHFGMKAHIDVDADSGQFGHTKVRYRGLKKNTAQLVTLCALSNIWMARSRLLRRAQA
jgi:IS5 family transposase